MDTGWRIAGYHGVKVVQFRGYVFPFFFRDRILGMFFLTINESNIFMSGYGAEIVSKVTVKGDNPFL